MDSARERSSDLQDGAAPAQEPGVAPPPPDAAPKRPDPAKLPKEIGGAPGPEPTRYGDWQHKGRVTDF